MTVHLLNPYMLNPRTGERLRGMFIVNSAGRVIHVPPVMGGAPDDDDGDSGDSGTEADSGGAGSGESVGAEGGAATKDSDDDSSKKSVTRNEFEALTRRMQAADKRASDAENRLKEQERAKLDEGERTKAELKDAQEEIAKLKEKSRQLNLQNAWLGVNSVVWHDPEDAMTIAERKGVFTDMVSDDGKVETKKLRTALDKFAKEHPHLVKAESGTSGGGAPPGDSVGSKHKGKDNGRPNEDEIKKRYSRLIR
jgi:hypothetical protein